TCILNLKIIIMKKTILFVAFAMLCACAALAQDSTNNGAMQKHHTLVHKKTIHRHTTMHNNSSTTSDNVSGAKITTNNHSKMETKSTMIRRKRPTHMTHVRTTTTVTDSTK
ncbi:MAG: hypothetical protein ABI834_02820, partial [Ginsengibacter sp.]